MDGLGKLDEKSRRDEGLLQPEIYLRDLVEWWMSEKIKRRFVEIQIQEYHVLKNVVVWLMISWHYHKTIDKRRMVIFIIVQTGGWRQNGLQDSDCLSRTLQ